MTENELNGLDETLDKLTQELCSKKEKSVFSFSEFLTKTSENPNKSLRNIFQLFYDMVHHYVELDPKKEKEELGRYNCDRLFVDGLDKPFFADMFFGDRLVERANSFRGGNQQNKIYVFEGEPGSGKSTFLNALVKKFIEYTRLEEGSYYETLWRIDKKEFPGNEEGFLEVPCPHHDHPILFIPKQYRLKFLDNLIQDKDFKKILFEEKQFDWVFQNEPCTICNSLYRTLFDKFSDVKKVLENIFVRKTNFNRRLGEGITIYNSGDAEDRRKNFILTNEEIQKSIGELFRDSNKVRYSFSKFAKTNNGMYFLMDIKETNIPRMTELHGIISDGVHKVGDIEENINSLFMAVMNPEDMGVITNVESFMDRVVRINIPYVLDYKTEVEIYRNTFGKHIDDYFLPGVLDNFAKAVVSTRLEDGNEAIQHWIREPGKYQNFCDEHLLVLKLDLYAGKIPSWLSEEDKEKLDNDLKKDIFSESENEGNFGFSGRDSIKHFDEFFSQYAKKDSKIDMDTVQDFFIEYPHKKKDALFLEKPEGVLVSFDVLDALVNLYDYDVLQKVKDAMYRYKEDRISKDILNYFFLLTCEFASERKCPHTGEDLKKSIALMDELENNIFGSTTKNPVNKAKILREYVAVSLSREMDLSDKSITETKLYADILRNCLRRLKNQNIGPLKSEAFRNALNDYGSSRFDTYSARMKRDVNFMLDNLVEKHDYDRDCARQICIYIIDKAIVKKF